MLGPSAQLYKFLNDILAYQECPSSAPSYLVDEILKLIKPDAGYYVIRGNEKLESKKLGFNGLVAIGGQGILLKVMDNKNRKIALKIAKPAGPVNLNKKVYRDGVELDAMDIQAIPDVRFGESSKLQQAVEMAMTKESVGFIVPRVYDFGDMPVPFVSMEWVDSEDVIIYLADKKDLKLSLRTFFGVLEAADFLHHHNIVFRDFKSKNIRVGSGERIVLLDFGLAKEMQDRNLTLTGAPIGTWPYASPKLLDGFGDRATPPDDIHALGYTLFEFIIKGECPGYDVDPRDTKARETYREKLVELLPVSLQTIFLKSTEPWERARYQTIKEMLTDLHSAYCEITTRDISPHRDKDYTVVDKKEKEKDKIKPLVPPQGSPISVPKKKDKDKEEKFKHFMATSKFAKAQFSEENEDEKQTDKLESKESSGSEDDFFRHVIEENQNEILSYICSNCNFEECKKGKACLCKNQLLANLEFFKKIFLE